MAASQGWAFMEALPRFNYLCHRSGYDDCRGLRCTLYAGYVFLVARVMYKAVLGLHYQRQQQKKDGQLAIL
jgi:hypothetical protein